MDRTLATQAAELIGKEVLLKGWVNSRRDHGGLIFIDLRDHTGIIQVVSNPQLNEKSFKVAETLHDEFVIEVRGTVRKRQAELVNPNIETGEIEVYASEIQVLTKSKTLPFQISEGEDVNEELRLKYRYLDLRRPKLQKHLFNRAKMIKFM